MSWQIAVFTLLAVVIVAGFGWYERARPPARLVALVAALAALAVAGRLVLAPIPNVVATTDIAMLTGYALGGPPGFAVGALAAPISNIWLGQGPWTAWQMAGWGLVGLAGAWLAVASGRRLGRLGLAVSCALAGLAYGALLDLSVMVTYGGEQSLDRYLALSARGVPFNLAHAAGNFAIALLAGPALVRMITRYRTRLEFTWHPAGALPLALLALLAGALAFAPSESGAEPGSERLSKRETSVRWLSRTQNSDGGFGATTEYPSSPAITGWVMLGLEGAGRNPLDVRSHGRSPVAYLRSHLDRLSSPGDLERTILALEGAGLDSRAFAGTDLVAELRSQRRRDGSVRGQVNLTAFFVLALRSAGVDSGALGRPLSWLRSRQGDDGGWGFRPGAPSDADSTGAVLQALAAAGAGDGRASAGGSRWLRRAQHGDGGFALATNGVVNAQSTAWAVQGLLAAGEGERAVRRAIGKLERLRADDGHYRYSGSSDQTPVWVTAQALLAVEERAFPLGAVAREPAEPADDPSGIPNDEGIGTIPTPTPPPSGYSGPVVSGPDLGALPDYGGLGGGGGFGGGPAVGGGGSGPGATPGGGGSGGGSDPAAGQPTPQPASDLGTFAERVIAASTEPTSTVVEDEPLTPYVAGGLGLLALALGGGFLWYRRTLP
jgi:energy-coupling factor transport system substrate-specific component